MKIILEMLALQQALENNWSKLKQEISGNLQEQCLLEKECKGLQEIHGAIKEQRYKK